MAIDGGDAFSDFVTPPTGGSFSPIDRTVADVLRAAKRQFGDESGVQIEDADILSWINDAQEAINAKNKVLKASSTVASVGGQSLYTFPPLNIHQIESLHYGGSRLPNMSFAQVEEAGLDNAVSGSPELWYEWAGKFTLYPKPLEASTITLYYTVRPVKVTSAADFLSLPDKYYNDIVRYVLQQAYELDEDWAASQAKAQQFDASVNEMGEEERTAQHATYSTITIY